MNQFDEFRGTFRPTNPQRLRGQLAERVGHSALWRAVWPIREGADAGRWSVYPLAWDDGASAAFWVLDSDVERGG